MISDMPEFQRPRYGSSHIHSLSYDTDGTLTVRFHSGGSYAYEGVDEDTYRALHESASPGRVFRERVKGRYRFKKV